MQSLADRLTALFRRLLGPSVQLWHPYRGGDGHAEGPGDVSTRPKKKVLTQRSLNGKLRKQHLGPYDGRPSGLLGRLLPLRPRRHAQKLPAVRLPCHQLLRPADPGLPLGLILAVSLFFFLLGLSEPFQLPVPPSRLSVAGADARCNMG
jgi:hypothetical protein